jgi:thiamine-monophosphate kinase
MFCVGSERMRIELLRAVLGGARAEEVLVGIGDDAAVIAPPSEPLVWTVDAAVEGVHFRRDLMGLRDAGYRATMAAASDLAAMGAEPLGILGSLVLPDCVSDWDLAALAAGQRAAADALGTSVIGGNLSRGTTLSITTTVLGKAARPLRRDGAREGDVIGLAGPVGLAGLGLLLLERRAAVRGAAARAAIHAFRRPVARLDAGYRARDNATAAIDISDGLARDLGHVARASGLCAVLDPEALLTPELVEGSARLGVDPLKLALYGGEDYALLIAVPPDKMPIGFVPIGHLIGRREPPVVLVGPDGQLSPIDEGGFDHFTED